MTGLEHFQFARFGIADSDTGFIASKMQSHRRTVSQVVREISYSSWVTGP